MQKENNGWLVIGERKTSDLKVGAEDVPDHNEIGFNVVHSEPVHGDYMFSVQVGAIANTCKWQGIALSSTCTLRGTRRGTAVVSTCIWQGTVLVSTHTLQGTVH